MTQNKNNIMLSSVISPSFFNVNNQIIEHDYTHFWFRGGRGSTKSSFIAISIIYNMMYDSKQGIYSNAVALRKVKDTLKDSVFEQLDWAIQILGVEHEWETKTSPLTLTYKPTGQKILFRGADKPKKIKSIKFSKGYCKYIWYEELDEFAGMDEIRLINQSLMRGGKDFICLYSYNPPKSQQNWVNSECKIEREDRIIHHTTYLQVPRTWLGEIFFLEAEHLKRINEKAYQHEYLGEVTGTGGEIFENVTVRILTEEEVNYFDKISRGIDFGYAVDPFVYTVNHFDSTRRKLYIFHEVYLTGLSNRKAIELVKSENVNNNMVIADSAEPKSIREFKDNGIRIKGAKKGPDSIEYGIKWLQDLEEIIIDPLRCPNTTKEFLNYELEKDSQGNFKANYPDKNNHVIDATRYSREDDINSRQITFFK